MAKEKQMVVYVGAYDDVDPALRDLDAFETMHDAEMIGDYDAAVIDREDGKPHIVKRADHPRGRAIPEFFGGGALPRNKLKAAAEELETGEVALVVVGEPTIEQAFDKTVTRAATIVKRDFNDLTDQVAHELTEAFKA